MTDFITERSTPIRILIIDDEAPLRLGMAHVLRSAGYDVFEAKNGKEGLRLARQHAPEIFVVDVNLPDIHGLEICRQLKTLPACANSRIALISGTATTSDAKTDGFDIGADDYIVRPLPNRELLARIRLLIRVKQAEDALRKQNTQLEELNASKDKFFSIIAHDLRNPLTGVLSFAGLLEDFESMESERRKMFFHEFRALIDNLFALLNNLLTWSRLQRGLLEYAPHHLPVNTVISRNLGLLTSNAKQKQISLIHTVQPDLKVYADVDMLDTIIRNLLSNAVKFTPSGGTVAISATADGECVTISVSDTGIGIPEQKLSDLFTIGTKTQRPGTAGEKGTGLGLILCKEFVEKNGGAIRVESQAGTGTTCIFTVPTTVCNNLAENT